MSKTIQKITDPANYRITLNGRELTDVAEVDIENQSITLYERDWSARSVAEPEGPRIPDTSDPSGYRTIRVYGDVVGEPKTVAVVSNGGATLPYCYRFIHSECYRSHPAYVCFAHRVLNHGTEDAFMLTELDISAAGEMSIDGISYEGRYRIDARTILDTVEILTVVNQDSLKSCAPGTHPTEGIVFVLML